jgi:hypothetical protein
VCSLHFAESSIIKPSLQFVFQFCRFGLSFGIPLFTTLNEQSSILIGTQRKHTDFRRKQNTQTSDKISNIDI